MVKEPKPMSSKTSFTFARTLKGKGRGAEVWLVAK